MNLDNSSINKDIIPLDTFLQKMSSQLYDGINEMLGSFMNNYAVYQKTHNHVMKLMPKKNNDIQVKN